MNKMFLNKVLTTRKQRYINPIKHYNTYMNTKNMSFAISLIIASFAIATISGLSAVQGHTPNTIPYGEIGQEDEAYFWHDGVLYINAVPSVGNGLFLAESDIDQDYSIDQAIERFGINEDSTSFIVQPSVYTNVVIMYQLDDNLQFQLVDIYEDSETGFYQEVMEK